MSPRKPLQGFTLRSLCDLPVTPCHKCRASQANGSNLKGPWEGHIVSWTLSPPLGHPSTWSPGSWAGLGVSGLCFSEHFGSLLYSVPYLPCAWDGVGWPPGGTVFINADSHTPVLLFWVPNAETQIPDSANHLPLLWPTEAQAPSAEW